MAQQTMKNQAGGDRRKIWQGISALLLVILIIAVVNFASSKVEEENPELPSVLFSAVTLAPSSKATEQNFFPVITKNYPPGSRGYMTTSQELALVSRKAAMNIQPYRDAVDNLLEFVGKPYNWPYGTINGEQNCTETLQPAFIGEGAPLIFAKSMAYHLTGNTAYADEVRTHLLDLTDTYGYGGEVYSGENQCILNLSWYIPNWIMAADLIERYPNWRTQDKRQFQLWLANEIYKKVAWNSRHRRNNWGSAGSTTSGMIADYLWDSSYLLEGETPHQAYIEHKIKQLERMDTVKKFDSVCNIWGIQWYGGIPDELERGSSGCLAHWIVEQDGSWSYSMAHLQGTVLHAEFLLRRGDSSLYDHVAEDGSGSILKAIHFIIANPFDPSKSTDWRESSKQTLEVTYRYYRDNPTAIQLRIGTEDRYIGGKSNPMLHFGTITHAFATYENPGMPPTVPPP